MEMLGEFQKKYTPRWLTWEERIEFLEGLQRRLCDEVRRLEEFQVRYQETLTSVDSAESVGDLKDVHDQCNLIAIDGFLESYSVKAVQGLCSGYRDRIVNRLLTLVEEEMMREGFGSVPTPYAWMAMGSDGRREQTLFTDQDNLLVYGEEGEGIERLWDMGDRLTGRLMPLDFGEEASVRTHKDVLDGYYEVFSRKMVERLGEIGIEKCKGGVMPSNEKWRDTISEWKDRLRGKIAYGTGDLTTLDLIIVMDLRYVGGDKLLAEELIDFVNEHTGANIELLTEMARSAILMAVPLGLFKRFITEKSGEHKGEINLKLGGWAPLVLITRLLARKYGLTPTRTLDRIDALARAGVFNEKFAQEMREAYYELMKQRVLHQIEQVKREAKNDEFVNPQMLTEDEQERLRRALRTLEAAQKLANRIFFAGGVVG